MWTIINSTANAPRMILWATRCRVHAKPTTVAVAKRTPQRTENMGSRTGLGKCPVHFLCVGDRFANVLIGMICHALAHGLLVQLSQPRHHIQGLHRPAR